MNKLKVLSWLVVTLAVINIGVVSMMVFRRPPHPIHHGPKALIIEKLQFDATQIAEYDKLIAVHRQGVNRTEQQIHDLKNDLYSLLNKELNEHKRDSLISEIGKWQVKIENIHYKHFMDLKGICTKEQLPLFKKLTLEIARLFSPHPKRR
jgi:protein CpxP